MASIIILPFTVSISGKVDGFQHHGDGMEIKTTCLFQLKEAHGSQLGKIVYGQDPSDTCQFRYFQSTQSNRLPVFSSLSP